MEMRMLLLADDLSYCGCSLATTVPYRFGDEPLKFYSMDADIVIPPEPPKYEVGADVVLP